MHVKTVSVVIVLVAVLLLAQTVSVVEAHHKKNDKGETRKAAEKKSEAYDRQGNLNLELLGHVQNYRGGVRPTVIRN